VGKDRVVEFDRSLALVLSRRSASSWFWRLALNFLCSFPADFFQKAKFVPNHKGNMLAECENVFPLPRKSGQMPAAHEVHRQKHPFGINRFESATYL
jgi:hypothetical protein